MEETALAYAQPAYRLDAFPLYEPEGVERVRRPDVHAVRGGAQPAPSSSPLFAVAISAAVIIVVVAILSFARIALMNATVNTLIEADALSVQVAEARTTGTSLEMEQSALTSPTAINAAVKRMGMYEPYMVGSIALPQDVVATDADGTLSFSGTVKNLVGSQE